MDTKRNIFADKALQKFKTLNPTSEVHIRHLYILEDHIPTTTATYMSSPTSPTIDNAVLPFHDAQDYPISCIFGQLIKPKCGRVSPNFIEYQDKGITGQPRMEEDGERVEEGTDLAGQMPAHALVRIPFTSDITDVLCTHNNTKEYCHYCNNDIPLFIPPPAFAQTILGVLHASQAASEVGTGPLTGYHLSTRSEEGDSDKENYQDATEVLQSSQDGQGMGSRQGGGGRQGKDRRSVGSTEKGPICLYHPGETRSVGTQHSESPIPEGFDRNHHHHYIPFHIMNSQGKMQPAKYVSVFMTNNPYTLGKLESNGPTYMGEIHASPQHDYPEKSLHVEDLQELLPSWHKYHDVNDVLVLLHDRSLQAEVHRYRYLMGHLAQLDAQMATIEGEMSTLIPEKHECADWLMKAQAVHCIRRQVGQQIRRVSPWEVEHGCST